MPLLAPPGPSERQGLGAPGVLAVPVAAQRLDGGAGQRLVGAEQPLEDLGVAVPAVLEHGDQARQVLEDGAALEEVGRDPAVAAARDGHELVLAQQLADPVRRDPQYVGDLRGGERLHDVRAYDPRRPSCRGTPTRCCAARILWRGAVTGAAE